MRNALLLATLITLGTTPAFAADPAPAAPTAKPGPTLDFTKAIAGTYTLDTRHVGLVAYVSHMGFSLSVFRFDKVEGTLTWDPANVAKSALTAKAQTGSIATNVPGFAEELAGPKYLNAPAFPEATFVSTAFHQTDATHGKVDGTFTLKGKTSNITLDVTLIGAGMGYRGHVIGIHAEGTIDPQKHDMPDFFKAPIKIVIDAEFDRQQ